MNKMNLLIAFVVILICVLYTNKKSSDMEKSMAGVYGKNIINYISLPTDTNKGKFAKTSSSTSLGDEVSFEYEYTTENQAVVNELQKRVDSAQHLFDLNLYCFSRNWTNFIFSYGLLR